MFPSPLHLFSSSFFFVFFSATLLLFHTRRSLLTEHCIDVYAGRLVAGGVWSFEVPGGVLCCCLFDFPVIFNTVPHCRPNSLPCYEGFFFQALQWPVCSKVFFFFLKSGPESELNLYILVFCTFSALKPHCWLYLALQSGCTAEVSEVWNVAATSWKPSILIFAGGIFDQLLIIIDWHSMICNWLAVLIKADHKCQSEPKPESLIYSLWFILSDLFFSLPCSLFLCLLVFVSAAFTSIQERYKLWSVVSIWFRLAIKM